MELLLVAGREGVRTFVFDTSLVRVRSSVTFKDMTSHNPHFDESVADPRQRFVSGNIEDHFASPHSRDPPSVTHESFSHTMTDSQIMPSFLGRVFTCGLPNDPRGFHCTAFTAKSCLFSDDRALCVPTLRRSGLHIEACYTFTALHRAAAGGRRDIFEVLVARHELDANRQTALHLVARSMFLGKRYKRGIERKNPGYQIPV